MAVSQELLSDWWETKKANQLDTGWLLAFNHTHNRDLVVSRSKFEIALFEEWEGWLTWSERDVS